MPWIVVHQPKAGKTCKNIWTIQIVFDSHNSMVGERQRQRDRNTKTERVRETEKEKDTDRQRETH